MQERIKGFDPIVDERTRLIILGSMPGVESLRRAEYYAHPQNRFWKVIDDALRIDRRLPYEKRVSELSLKGIGLWDVACSCSRRGSLDSNIVMNSVQVNDFKSLFCAYLKIKCCLFNGAQAFKVFNDIVAPNLDEATRDSLSIIKLPSTSPANARFRYEDILGAWASAFLQNGIIT